MWLLTNEWMNIYLGFPVLKFLWQQLLQLRTKMWQQLSQLSVYKSHQQIHSFTWPGGTCGATLVAYKLKYFRQSQNYVKRTCTDRSSKWHKNSKRQWHTQWRNHQHANIQNVDISFSTSMNNNFTFGTMTNSTNNPQSFPHGINARNATKLSITTLF